MSKRRSTWMAVALLGVSLSWGLPAMALDGKALFNTRACAACHGVNGDKSILPGYPKINGQNSAYLVQQMLDIKSGARNNGQSSVMKAIMPLVNEEEIKAIADWLSLIK